MANGADRYEVTVDASSIDAFLDQIDSTDAPGAAVGVASAGQAPIMRAVGRASLELPVALAHTMRLRIASISKQFTALTYLLLCEDGSASLDDRAATHLPDLAASLGKISVRELLEHSSGLWDIHDICWNFMPPGRLVPSATLLDMLATLDGVQAQPGERWIYSNTGYAIVSAIIERISGEPLEEVFRARIFEPLGMMDTLLRRGDDDFVVNSATLHMLGDGGGYVRKPMNIELAGEGGIVSTIPDMLRWMQNIRRPTIGSRDTWLKMHREGVLTNGSGTGYALGTCHGSYRGRDILFHSGGVWGGTAHMLHASEADLDIVVMTNRQDLSATDLAHDLADLCFDIPPESGSGAPAPCSGFFAAIGSTRFIELHGHKGQQHITLDGYEIPLALQADGLFRPTETLAMLRFVLDLRKFRQGRIAFGEFGTVREFRTVTDDVTVIPRTGTFLLAGNLGVTAAIIADESAVRLNCTGPLGEKDYRLTHKAGAYWQADPLGWGSRAILHFTPDGEAFSYSNLRNSGLHFAQRSLAQKSVTNIQSPHLASSTENHE